jgi:hypothetical protein
VYRTVTTDGRHYDVFGQPIDYSVRMAASSRNVPYGFDLLLLLKKGGDGSPPGLRPTSVSHRIEYQMHYSSHHDLPPQDTNTRTPVPAG